MQEQVITDHDIADAMMSFGGGFVEALARAFYRADPCNAEKLKRAFPEYWAEYRDIAKRHKAPVE